MPLTAPTASQPSEVPHTRPRGSPPRALACTPRAEPQSHRAGEEEKRCRGSPGPARSPATAAPPASPTRGSPQELAGPEERGCCCYPCESARAESRGKSRRGGGRQARRESRGTQGSGEKHFNAQTPTPPLPHKAHTTASRLRWRSRPCCRTRTTAEEKGGRMLRR